MKKSLTFVFSFALLNNCFAQNITLLPNSINKSSSSAGDDIVITNASSSPLPLIVGRSSRGSIAVPSATRLNDTFLSIVGKGYNGVDFGTTPRVSIDFKATENWGTAFQGTKINFTTTENNTIISGTKMVINDNGRVGIGFNITPATLLDVRGDFALTKTKELCCGITHTNLDREGASVITVSLGGGIETISGIVGSQGTLLYIYPQTGKTIILLNEDTGSTENNRILTPNSAPITLNGKGGATLIYDGNTTRRWRIVSVAN